MEINIDQTRWWQRIYAAFIFFTRLPLWRIYQPPKQCYDSVVEHWPLVGWLTGGLMAAILYFGGNVAPWPLVVLVAIGSRVLLTGALHEDGLADFIDGFGGGGNDRERILAIMKDSHIGTYGVVGLLFYFALLYLCLLALSPREAALAVLAADPFAKMVTSQLILMMPYARTEQTAKSGTIYRRPSTAAGVCLAVQGLLPLAVIFWLFPSHFDLHNSPSIFFPCLVMYFLYRMIWNRLRGYTGDCCGAVCLLVELAFYLGLLFNYGTTS